LCTECIDGRERDRHGELERGARHGSRLDANRSAQLLHRSAYDVEPDASTRDLVHLQARADAAAQQHGHELGSIGCFGQRDSATCGGAAHGREIDAATIVATSEYRLAAASDDLDHEAPGSGLVGREALALDLDAMRDRV